MSTKRSAILRAHYVSSMKGFDPECMIFIDESHVDDRSSRRRMGRALKGKKAKVYEFLGRGNSHSILAAMNIDGFVLKACRTLDFTVNESVFMTWARECLAPVLGAYPNNRNSIVILDNAGMYMSKKPTKADILSVFAGLRPLAASENGSETTKEVSRHHKVLVSPSGLISVLGGKWTTYRKMGEDAIDNALVVGALPPRKCQTENMPIHGYEVAPDWTDPLHVYGSFRKKKTNPRRV